MPKTVAVKTNFNSGELSPRMRGRTDLPEYRNGAETIENFVPAKQGGAAFRSGTSYVADVKDSSVFTRMVSFTFSVTQTYILEFGNLYIRFYRDSGQLVQVAGDPSEGTITEITTTYTTAQLRALKFTQSADILYITHPDHEPQELRRTSGNDTDPTTWSLNDFDMQDGPYLPINTTSTTLKVSDDTAGASVTVTASSTTGINGGDGFKTTDVGRLIRMTDEEDLLWGWLEITGHTNTTVVTATIRSSLDLSVDPDETTRDWRLGAWSDTTGWPWAANFHQQSLWFGGTNEQPQRLDRSRVGDFNRFGPSKNTGEVRDTDGLVFIISDNEVNAIRWIFSHALGILVLTEGEPFIGRTRGLADPITPTNFSMTAQTNYGAHATVRPYKAGEAILMPLTAGRKIRELVFRRDDDQIVAPDMTVLADHVTEGGLLDSAYQQEPGGILWLVRNDGVLLGMTYERTEGVVGWHRHILGGTLDGSDQPEIESIAVIREGDDDQLWMTVKRTIDGSTKRFVEFMKPQFKVDTDKEFAFHVDAGLTLDDRKTITDVQTRDPVIITSAAHGFSNLDRVRIRAVKGTTQLNDNTYTVANAATNTFELQDADGNDIDGSSFTAYISGGTVALEVSTVSNLEHLEGETVAVFGDGGDQAQQVVADGSITLENTASLVAVGLPYTGTIKTMPMMPAGANFDPRVGLQRIEQMLLVLERTLGGKAGVDGDLDDLIYREVDDLMDESVPLFSGVQELAFPASSTREATVTIQQTSPQPMNVLAVIARMTIDDV